MHICNHDGPNSASMYWHHLRCRLKVTSCCLATIHTGWDCEDTDGPREIGCGATIEIQYWMALHWGTHYRSSPFISFFYQLDSHKELGKHKPLVLGKFWKLIHLVSLMPWFSSWAHLCKGWMPTSLRVQISILKDGHIASHTIPTGAIVDNIRKWMLFVNIPGRKLTNYLIERKSKWLHTQFWSRISSLNYTSAPKTSRMSQVNNPFKRLQGSSLSLVTDQRRLHELKLYRRKLANWSSIQQFEKNTRHTFSHGHTFF